MSPNPSFVDILKAHAEHQPRATAFRFLADGETETGHLTYQQLDVQARAIAAKLQSHYEFGERAILVYPDSGGLEFIAAFLGCLYAGIIAIPMNPTRNYESIKNLIKRAEHCDVACYLTTQGFQHYLHHRISDEPALAKPLWSKPWHNTDEIPSSLADDWLEPDISGDTIAFFQHTSGSTGQPKAAIITHGNLLHNSKVIYGALEHDKNSSFVSWLPLFHDMGLIGGVLQPLYGGFPCTLIPPNIWNQKPLCWLKAISHYKATTSGGPNFAYELLARTTSRADLAGLDLSHWSVAFSGSETVRASTLQNFAAAFESTGFSEKSFYPCYGMAESTLFSSGGQKRAAPNIIYLETEPLKINSAIKTSANEQATAIVSCGTHWADDTILIVDPKTGKTCNDLIIGEVWLTSKSISQGYWQAPDETKQTFQAYIQTQEALTKNNPHIPPGPYLKTGDLGFLDNKELYITGRLKEIMCFRGRYHYPQHIEKNIETAHPALRPGACAAFSIDASDDERLILACEIKRSFLRKIDIEAWVDAIQEILADEHGLSVFAICFLKTGSMPKTSSGKIRRRTCKELFLTKSLNCVGQWHRQT